VFIMRVNIMPCRFPLKMAEWPLLMEAGIAQSGDTSIISQQPDESDVHLFWGLRKRFGKQALANKKRCLIIERAFLGDRFKWHSLGYNSINGYADFCNNDVSEDRWLTHWADSMQDWRDGGDYALVVGQVQGDAALRGQDVYKWANQAVQDAKRKYGRVIFRPHPLDKFPRKVEGAEYHTGDLQEVLSNAAVVITYNSNTGVDAVMAGIPAISYDKGSMVWDISSHSIKEDLIRPDRSDWGRKIAYAQWLPSELKDGTAWRHVRRFA